MSAPLDPREIPPDRLRAMLKQREEALRFLGVLVERLGGEVRISPVELMEDRFVKKDDIGFTGVVVLRVEKP